MRKEEEENELTQKCKHPPEKVTKPKKKSRQTDILFVLFLKTKLNCLSDPKTVKKAVCLAAFKE